MGNEGEGWSHSCRQGAKEYCSEEGHGGIQEAVVRGKIALYPTQSPYHESLWAQLATAMTAHQLGAAQGPIVTLSGLLLLNPRQGHPGGQGQECEEKERAGLG